MSFFKKTSVLLLLLFFAGFIHDVQHKLTDSWEIHSEIEQDTEDCLLQAQASDGHSIEIFQAPDFIFTKAAFPVILTKQGHESRVNFLIRGPPALI